MTARHASRSTPWAATARRPRSAPGAIARRRSRPTSRSSLVGDAPTDPRRSTAATARRPASTSRHAPEQSSPSTRSRPAAVRSKPGVVARRHRGRGPRGRRRRGGLGRLDRRADGRRPLFSMRRIPGVAPARSRRRAPGRGRSDHPDRLPARTSTRGPRCSSSSPTWAPASREDVLGIAGAARRPAVDRRGARQGQPADAEAFELLAAEAGLDFARQHRGPRPDRRQGAT